MASWVIAADDGWSPKLIVFLLGRKVEAKSCISANGLQIICWQGNVGHLADCFEWYTTTTMKYLCYWLNLPLVMLAFQRCHPRQGHIWNKILGSLVERFLRCNSLRELFKWVIVLEVLSCRRKLWTVFLSEQRSVWMFWGWVKVLIFHKIFPKLQGNPWHLHVCFANVSDMNNVGQFYSRSF